MNKQNLNIEHEEETLPIPRYWAFSSHPDPSFPKLWESSPYSQQDAQEKADKEAARWAEMMEHHPKNFARSKARLNSDPNHEYRLPLPLREKLLDEIKESTGKTIGFLTRNINGSVVLNCRNLLILDWDIALHKIKHRVGFLKRVLQFIRNLFVSNYDSKSVGRKNNSYRKNPKEELYIRKYPWLETPFVDVPGGPRNDYRPIDFLFDIVAYIEKHPDWSVRIYQTAAGWRGIVTHAPFKATDKNVLALMDQFYCDWRYKFFCKHQHCFRARITPKAGRCGFEYSKITQGFRFIYPFDPDDPTAEERYNKGVEAYDQKTQGYSVCRYLGTIGSGTIHPELLSLVNCHDDATLGENPLA